MRQISQFLSDYSQLNGALLYSYSCQILVPYTLDLMNKIFFLFTFMLNAWTFAIDIVKQKWHFSRLLESNDKRFNVLT